jgi:glycosyltransferase involved in cell wall biosynthesis
MTRKPSILMVIERFFPIAGGAETQCFQLSSGFVKKGHQVGVVTKRWMDELKSQELFDEGFSVYRLGLSGASRLTDYFAGLSLFKFFLFKGRAFDIVYVNGGLANVFGSTAILLGKIFGQLVVSKVETPGELTFSGLGALSPKRFIHPLIKIRLAIVKWTDLFIAQTVQVKDELIGMGIAEERIVNFTNSVDTGFFAPLKSSTEKKFLKKKWRLPKSKLIFTYCGRLVRRKGLLNLINAWQKVDNQKAVLLIVGSGKGQPDSIEEELRRAAGDIKDDGVIFLDPQPREAVAEILKTSDAFVYPSIHPEGTALSVLEAMAVGLPVIVSDIGGLNEVVLGEDYGVVVPPDNIEELAAAISDLIKNPNKREGLGKKGRWLVAERFSTEKLVEKYLLLFSQNRK